MKKYLIPSVLIALLSACGGGGGNAPADPAPVAVDAFIKLINSDYAAANDTAEPNAIDAIAVTAPETTEPIPI